MTSLISLVGVSWTVSRVFHVFRESCMSFLSSEIIISAMLPPQPHDMRTLGRDRVGGGWIIKKKKNGRVLHLRGFLLHVRTKDVTKIGRPQKNILLRIVSFL